jgi:transcriptional repressor NrdR
MRCPKCAGQDDRVIDSRASKEGATIRRRRECLHCGHRFTTYEQIEHDPLMVEKRDGRREEFSKEKLAASLKRACQKRPVSEDAIAGAVDNISEQLASKYDREVRSTLIGERVMRELRALDKVAYVRFASIYRNFDEAEDFVDEVERLAAQPAPDKRQLELIGEPPAPAP